MWYLSLSLYIYIYIHIILLVHMQIRPAHLLLVFLLRVPESNFPGDPLSNSTDMRIPTPEI